MVYFHIVSGESCSYACDLAVIALKVPRSEHIDESDPVFLSQTTKSLQQLNGAGIGPVKVLHDDHGRPQLSSLDHKLPHILENELLQGLAFYALDPFRMLSRELHAHEGCHKW